MSRQTKRQQILKYPYRTCLFFCFVCFQIASAVGVVMERQEVLKNIRWSDKMLNEEVWKIANEGIVSDQNNDKKEELDRTCVESSAAVKRHFGVFDDNFQWSDARFSIVWRHK